MATEDEVYHDADDIDQINYLRWDKQRDLLKAAFVRFPRMKEEYDLARRICLGYRGQDIAPVFLVDALGASFIMDKQGLVPQEEIQKTIDRYFGRDVRGQISSWQEESKEIYDDAKKKAGVAKNLELDRQLSPLSIARLYGREAVEATKEPSYDERTVAVPTTDLAVYFASLRDAPEWSSAAKDAFQQLAVREMAKRLCGDRSPAALKMLVDQEMYDIIKKEDLTEKDHLRFELVGRVGQYYGLDLDEMQLALYQGKLSGKPRELDTLNVLRKIQVRRHSLLGRLGLRTVHNIRG